MKKGMSLIVRTISRLIVAPIFLLGVYIVLHGHLTPGGGFPGGVILGSSIVLLIIAYGYDVATKKISYNFTRILDAFGALFFICVALAGLAIGYLFTNYWKVWRTFEEPAEWLSAGTIVVSNIAIGIKVLGAIAAMFFALVVVTRLEEME